MIKNIYTNRKNDFQIRWIYAILGIVIMLCLGTVYSWSIFRGAVEKFYNIGATQSGFPYMVSLAFYALFMFLSGPYLSKYSPRLIILVGGILVGAGWILSGYAQNIYILTITYGVIIGSGVGIVYGVPMNVVAKWFPEKKGLMVGLVLVGFGLSPFITAPLASKLMEIYGILTTFKILGVAFGIIIPLLSYAFKYPLQAKEGSVENKVNDTVDNNTSEMIKSKNFKGIYISFLIGTMIGLMIVGMTNSVGVDMIKLPQNKVTFLMTIFAVFNGVGRPTFGWITDKLNIKKSMLISYGLISIAAILMLLAKEGSVVLYTIAFCIFWFNLGGWLAIAPASTLSTYGTKYYSQNYGVVFTAYGLGAVIGVLISGILKDIADGYHPIFLFILFLCLLGLLSSQRLIKIKRA